MENIGFYILFFMFLQLTLFLRIIIYDRNKTRKDIVKEMILTDIVLVLVIAIIYVIKFIGSEF